VLWKGRDGARPPQLSERTSRRLSCRQRVLRKQNSVPGGNGRGRLIATRSGAMRGGAVPHQKTERTGRRSSSSIDVHFSTTAAKGVGFSGFSAGKPSLQGCFTQGPDEDRFLMVERWRSLA